MARDNQNKMLFDKLTQETQRLAWPEKKGEQPPTSIEKYPLLSAVMKKEGEARHAAALAEIKRLENLILPILTRNKMTLGDFLKSSKPFGEVSFEYEKAREALRVAFDTFCEADILNNEEIREIFKTTSSS